jgi:DNA-binding CsgD family transcriptional regulator
MAVRACDRRIEPYRMAAIVRHWSSDGRGEIVREEVTLDAEVLRRLCAPVSVDRLPGESPSRLAERLGVGMGAVQRATRRGVFTVAKSFGLDGVRRGGRLLYTDRLLDPCSPVLRAADVIWGWTWRAAGERVPADFSQTIVREPEYRKWPGVRKFVGWRWICPGCKERVRTIYLPVRAMNLAEYFGARPEFDELDKVEDPPRALGCTRCHRVRYFSRVDRHAWNALIAHCTGGLLYGREVRKPEFWRETRRRKYRPSLGRAPSKRREEVRALLLKRMTIPQIGRELGISVNTVWNHVRVIYGEMGVHSRKDFLAGGIEGENGRTGERETDAQRACADSS